MPKALSFLLLLLLGAFTGKSQPAENPPETWLWKLNSETGQAPTYLFATLHHAHPAFLEAFSLVAPYLQRSMAYASVWPADALSKNELLGYCQRSDGNALRKEYKQAEFEPLDLLVGERFGDALLSYTSWQPLYLRQILRDAGRKSGRLRFVEEDLHLLAKGYGLETHSLVSPATLADLMQAVPLQDQLDLVKAYGSQTLVQDDALDRLAALYARADWEALASASRLIEGEAAAMRMQDGLALMTAISVLETAYAPGRFLAVPAELLGGPNGLFVKLKELGIGFSPVALPGYGQKLQTGLPNWLLEGPKTVDSKPVAVQETQAQQPFVQEAQVQTPNPEHVQAGGPLFGSLENRIPNSTPKYLADPFGELIEFDDLDTGFLRQWINYQPREKDFQTRLPFAPEIVTNTFRAEGGVVEVQIYLLNDPVSSLYCLISRNAYPKPFELSDPARFFDNAVEGTRSKFNGLVLAQRPVSTPIYRGREFVLSLPEGQYLRGRTLLVDNQLYQIVCIGERDVAWSDEAEVFLRSFKLPRANVRTWAHVESPNFRARMPLAPITAKRNIQTAGGPVLVDLWSLEDPLSKITYFISTSHYPAEVAKSEKEFMDQIVEGTVSNLGGILTQDETIKLGRHRGRAIALNTAQKQYRIRFFLIEGDLHQIMVAAADNKVTSADAEYYLSTFVFQ
ncbi:MAG: hypothetical protein GC205_08860 [Bacteroidetes bacterium]|nr:hypothetical protein [Bacteroidota bacterium]